jgi:hypothetical protein
MNGRTTPLPSKSTRAISFRDHTARNFPAVTQKPATEALTRERSVTIFTAHSEDGESCT